MDQMHLQQHSDLHEWQESCPLIVEVKAVDQTWTHLNGCHTYKWSDSVFTLDHLQKYKTLYYSGCVNN